MKKGSSVRKWRNTQSTGSPPGLSGKAKRKLRLVGRVERFGVGVEDRLVFGRNAS